jgi:hypothetical protein
LNLFAPQSPMSVAIRLTVRKIAVGEPGSLVGLSWVCHETIGLHSICERSRDGFGGMRRPSVHASRAGRVPGGVHAGLRPDHPLLRASEAVRDTSRQWIYVAAVLVGGGIALIEGRPWAAALACSAGGVLLILSVLLAAHRQRERDRAIELILEGRENVPIAAVQRQRRRLLARRTRQGLASSLEDLLQEVSTRRRLPLRPVAPLFEPRVVRAVTNELRGVIALLRTEGVSARGVARAERLVEHAISTLYGHDARALREELGRVRELLKG